LLSFVLSALLRISDDDIKRTKKTTTTTTKKKKNAKREERERRERDLDGWAIPSLRLEDAKNKQLRRVRIKKQRRTVGPALATINTVSPLGTALTVPRSHPVTGMIGLLFFFVCVFFVFFFCGLVT
jgi:hypothetical protein